MGREEILKSTKYVPPIICWLAYVVAFAVIWLTFYFSTFSDPIHTGLLAHALSTLSLFVFSFLWRNTSIYDPAWVYLPIGLALGWIESSPQVGLGGICAFAALVAWFLRYVLTFPWSGWTVGLEAEDWRYTLIGRYTGSDTMLYWIGSLVSFHFTPTILVFGALSPAERVWSNDSEVNAWVIIGMVTVGIAISILFISDRQLYDFRVKAYKTSAKLELDHLTSSKKTYRVGLWAYSRHPNYFGEALFWVGMAVLSYHESASLLRQWGGAVVMLLFFRVSAGLMDRRNLAHKREGYEKYMKEVSALIPWLPTRLGSE